MNKISSHVFCRHYVRDNGYGLYLIHFFAPRKKRRALLSIMALHTELRLIPQKVHDPMMRLIRLKWWHDEIGNIKNSRHFSDSPILTEINQNIKNYIEFDDYLNRFEKSLRGETADIDESLYKIFANIIDDKKQIEIFSNKLMLNDTLDEKTKLRALRLWLGF